MLKNTNEAMIKITPTATVKIANCLGRITLKEKVRALCAYYRVQSSKDICLEIGYDSLCGELDYRLAGLRFRAAAAFLAFSY